MIKVGDYVSCKFDKDRRECKVINIDSSYNPPRYEIRYPSGIAEWIELHQIDEIFSK